MLSIKDTTARAGKKNASVPSGRHLLSRGWEIFSLLSAPGPPQMPTMSVMPQQQQPQMQMQQQYPIYASGAQMTNHQNQQNGGPPIYVPSSISIQNSLNSVASGVKPSPAVAPMIPSHQNVNGSNYGHGQMMQQQQQIPQAPQYMPSLQQQVSVPAAPVPPPPPAFQNSAPCPPAAPQMPNIAQVAPNNANMGPGPALGGGAPPPPPPPPMSKPGGMDMGSLASQLQQAKLRKTSGPPPPPAENSGNSTSSSGSGNYGTIGRTSGAGEMASMMDEMAKTLARRRERQKDTNVSRLMRENEIRQLTRLDYRLKMAMIHVTNGKSPTRYHTSSAVATRKRFHHRRHPTQHRR